MAADLNAITAVAPEKKTPLKRETIFLELVARLAAENIPCCLVGDTAAFPQEIRSDADFVVTPEALSRIPQLLSDFCAERGIQLVQALHHETTAWYYTFAWAGPDGRACFFNPD